jgi:hypothetical protein
VNGGGRPQGKKEVEVAPTVVEVAEFILQKAGIPGLLGVPAVVLLTPEPWADRLGLLALRKDHAMWFGLAFAFGLALLLASIGRTLLGWGRGAWEWWGMAKRKKKLAALLSALDDEERDLVVHAFHYGGEVSPLLNRSGLDSFQTTITRLLSLGLVCREHGIRSSYYCIPREHMQTMTALLADEQEQAVEHRVSKGVAVRTNHTRS